MTDGDTMLLVEQYAALQEDYRAMRELARELAQVLRDHTLVSEPTWEKHRFEALKKAREVGIEVVPF